MSNERRKGPIAWMARNRVAANLLMLFIFVGGFLNIRTMKQEVFPEFEVDIVVVGVAYPGASPAEVEKGISLAIEESVRGVSGVKRVTSTSVENFGAIIVELVLGGNNERILSDIKSAVDRVSTLPEQAENPTIELIAVEQQVISLVISGDQELSTLRELADQARNALTALPDVTKVTLSGTPARETAIEISRGTLEEYGLSLGDIALAIRMSSMDLPGGIIETENGELLLRVSGRKDSNEGYKNIILRAGPDGGRLRLGDIATVRTGFEESEKAFFFNGKRAVRVTAYRRGMETPQQVSSAVIAYQKELSESLPSTVQVDTWKDSSELLKGRIDLLLRNAKLGLLLVLIVLALFLDLSLAFWVALGIPISFMGAFIVGTAFGVSINMISLFALIVTLGIVVDDAIVVGEAAWTRINNGQEPTEAAIDGAQEMVVPVTFAVLTTVAAFSPLLFIPGSSGKLFFIIPAMVISVLLFSLIESFFILPAHIGHKSSAGRFGRMWSRVYGVVKKPADKVRDVVSGALHRFIFGGYKRFLLRVLRYRYATVAFCIACFLLCVGLIRGGVVPFRFLPGIESDNVTVVAKLPYGTPVAQTNHVLKTLETSLQKTVDELDVQAGIKGIFSRIGSGPEFGGPGVAGMGAEGGHLLALDVGLVSSGERDFSAKELSDAWKLNTPEIAGLELLAYKTNIGGPGAGADIDLQISHPNAKVLGEASESVAAILKSYADLTDVDNGYSSGKPQLDFKLLPQGRDLGLTSQSIAQQLREQFYGAESLREQKGRDEVKVMVRLPREERQSERNFGLTRIRTPQGGFVALEEIAQFTRNRSPTMIMRSDGVRVVNIKAGLAPGVISTADVIRSLNETDLPGLRERFPGLKTKFVGEQQEQNESLQSLQRNGILAMFVIYVLLAIPFRSYTQPLLIMSSIPFGFVGAVVGHVLMGFELSFVSIMGIIALAGVVVNDSLVLVDAANKSRKAGAGPWEAIVYAGTRRFRPILLTSLTTFFGLLPMIFETSVQARFLVPMAVSLGYGVLFATVIALLFVPALYLIREDILNWISGSPVQPES
jgi:multidrug efflux pump subunit AcrB